MPANANTISAPLILYPPLIVSAIYMSVYTPREKEMEEGIGNKTVLKQVATSTQQIQA